MGLSIIDCSMQLPLLADAYLKIPRVLYTLSQYSISMNDVMTYSAP